MNKYSIEEIIDWIRTWECNAGESFMDYAGDDYIFLNVSFLLGYWSIKFPELYKFLMTKSMNLIPWKYPQDELTDLVEEFYSTKENWNEEDYCKSLIPWVSLIFDNDVYYERFIDWKEEQDEESSNL
jgi:hypothetical protein